MNSLNTSPSARLRRVTTALQLSVGLVVVLVASGLLLAWLLYIAGLPLGYSLPIGALAGPTISGGLLELALQTTRTDERLRRRKQGLIDAILDELDRVWGAEGFVGDAAQYDRLRTEYGISPADDRLWLAVLASEAGDFAADEPTDAELDRFLGDARAVNAFLEQLLQPYRSHGATEPPGWDWRSERQMIAHLHR